MKALRDSWLPLFLTGLLLAGPALAATPRKSAKPAPKPAAAAAAADQPLDATTLIAQARDAQSRGDSELAVRLAQSAIVAGPSRPDTYDALGDVYVANNQPDFARSYYGEALSVDPGDAPAQKALATLDHPGAQRAAKADAQGPQTGNP